MGLEQTDVVFVDGGLVVVDVAMVIVALVGRGVVEIKVVFVLEATLEELIGIVVVEFRKGGVDEGMMIVLLLTELVAAADVELSAPIPELEVLVIVPEMDVEVSQGTMV